MFGGYSFSCVLIILFNTKALHILLLDFISLRLERFGRCLAAVDQAATVAQTALAGRCTQTWQSRPAPPAAPRPRWWFSAWRRRRNRSSSRWPACPAKGAAAATTASATLVTVSPLIMMNLWLVNKRRVRACGVIVLLFTCS